MPNETVPRPGQLDGAWGRPRDVVMGQVDAPYLATSHRDGLGTVVPADHLIHRVWL